MLCNAILNLVLIPSLDRLGPSASAPPLSVIIPARNEARAIAGSVRALLDSDYGNLEVVVVDDRSSDGTGTILRGIASEDPRLVAVEGSEPPEGWLGKPWAVQQGGLLARGELLLFCDADVIYGPRAVSRLVGGLLSSGAGAIAVIPRFIAGGFAESVILPGLPLSGASFPVWLANRSQMPALALAGGPGILVHRHCWVEIGTHEALRNAVVDDIALARRLRAFGRMTLAVLGENEVSVRMYHGLHETVDGFTKNAFHAMGGSVPLAGLGLLLAMALHLVPWIASFQFASALLAGEVPRAASWVGAASIVPLILQRLVVFPRHGYGVVNALAGDIPMMAAWVWIGVRSIWLVGIRGILSWRGRDYDARVARFGG